MPSSKFIWGKGNWLFACLAEKPKVRGTLGITLVLFCGNYLQRVPLVELPISERLRTMAAAGMCSAVTYADTGEAVPQVLCSVLGPSLPKRH